MYDEDDMLMLSGIQHFVFCPRQWALIHMEGYWNDNVLTVQGSLLHSRVDDPAIRQRLNDNITLRHVSIVSRELGLYGITDAIELIPTDEKHSISHPKFPGNYMPFPIEYKRGRSKATLCDKLQLVAQAMCLEEMFKVSISKAALFYWEVRRREDIFITNELRDETRNISKLMHEVFVSKEIPHSNYESYCKRCSLIEVCQPKLGESKSVKTYLKKFLYEKNA